MILNKKPLSFTELKGYVKDLEEKEQLQKYLKKFGKTSKEKAEKITKEIKALNNPKIKESDIVKTVDFLPKDQEDMNKIFVDASLTEEEANTLVEIVNS